jgi:DHHC palmitoyltransferase
LTWALLEDLGSSTEARLDPRRLVQWRPAIPLLALGLVGGVSISYFLVFRRSIVEDRWCESSSYPRPSCRWMTVHDCIVIYLSLMTTFAFLTTTRTSPGIHLPPPESKRSEQPQKKYNPAAERALVSRFGDFDRPQQEQEPDSSHGGDKVFIHPCPASSRCETCDHVRPPRCHHCKICNCCVLVYDHHCLFMNQCIGYNNYRSFFQTILFVTLGCWYGVSILYKPFYEPVQEYLKGHGGLLRLAQSSIRHGTIPADLPNFFAIPTLADFWAVVTESNHPRLHQTVLDAVFPLVFAVGATMALFLGSHVKSVLRATTTLEHKIALDRMFRHLRNRLLDQNEACDERWVNPFDQGSAIKNWSTVLGSNPLLLFLPIPVPTPPPFLPAQKTI